MGEETEFIEHISFLQSNQNFLPCKTRVPQEENQYVPK